MPESDQAEGGQTYAVLDGVRRAKAAQLTGRATIDARIEGTGPVVQIPLGSILSPRDDIETAGVRGLDWGKILRATRRGLPLPPISVTPSINGRPLRDVEVKDEFGLFR